MGESFQDKYFNAGADRGPEDDQNMDSFCSKCGQPLGGDSPIISGLPRNASDEQVANLIEDFDGPDDLNPLIDPLIQGVGSSESFSADEESCDWNAESAPARLDEIELNDFEADGLAGGEQQPEDDDQEIPVGRDTRQRIQPGPSFYYPICQIICTFSGLAKEYVGTGVLVTRSLVLTAGHNFVKPNHRCTSVSINFLMYRSNSLRFRMTGSQLSRIKIARGYRSSSNPRWSAYDYAGVKLPRAISEFSPLKVIPSDRVVPNDSLIWNAGYPLEVGRSRPNGDRLYESKGKFRGTKKNGTRRYAVHGVDTSKGHSGGPMIYIYKAPSGNRVARVFGIHNKFARNPNTNFGAYLRGATLNEVRGWV